MIYDEPRFLSGGDRAVFIEFGDSIDPEANQRVISLKLAIEATDIPGVVESVPTYRSLLVYFEPMQISASELRETIRRLHRSSTVHELPGHRLVEIPMTYGGEFGPDLEVVAKHNNLRAEEVIRIHSCARYLIYMLGFMPGFPYLGGLSPKIAAPRKTTPRLKIPTGSVGIAGNQTGIYPTESPGGWQIIGRTPLKLFEPSREPPALLQAGDFLTFVRITPEEFTSIYEKVRNGTYKLNSELIE
jgi:KipI family sensor histidine kinase inhibitor